MAEQANARACFRFTYLELDGRGANISHIVVVRPYSYGYKSSSPAKVTYKHSAEGSDIQVMLNCRRFQFFFRPSELRMILQVSYSNDLGLLPVLSSKDDDKLSDPHAVRFANKLLK